MMSYGKTVLGFNRRQSILQKVDSYVSYSAKQGYGKRCNTTSGTDATCYKFM